MHNLTKRQLTLIRLLTYETEYRPILYFANKLNVSDKTLKDDLKQVRKYLSAMDLNIDGKTGKGILIDQKIKNNSQILSLLQSDREEIDKTSSDARRLTILKNMLLHSNIYTSVQKLSEEHLVSKASIVNDLKFVEHWIEKFNLSLKKSVDGTIIAGDEINIRKAIAALLEEFQKNDWSQNKSYYVPEVTRLDTETLDGLLEMFEIDEILYIESILSALEKEENMKIDNIYFVNLLTHLLIAIRRVKNGQQIEQNTQNTGMIRTDTITQYQQAVHLAHLIDEKYKVQIGAGEVFYIYQYLSSYRLNEDLPEDIVDDIQALSDQIIQYLSDVLGVDFTLDDDLYNGLLLHIRPLLNRLKYNIQITNPLLQEMKRSYPQLFGICQLILRKLEQQIQLNAVSNDEIAYIAAYCQTLAMRLKTPKNMIVVCHSGFGTSQLLVTKLKYEFPNINIVDAVSSRDLDAMDLNGIDGIISTVPIQDKRVPHILISAILSEQDIQSVRTLLSSPGDYQGQVVFPKQVVEQLDQCIVDFYPEKVEPDKRYRTETKVKLLPGLTVYTNIGVSDKTIVYFWIHQHKEMVIYVEASNETMFKQILSSIYQLSISKKLFETLLACSSEKEIAPLLGKCGS